MHTVPVEFKRKVHFGLAVVIGALVALVGLLIWQVLAERENLLQSVRQENLTRARSLSRQISNEIGKIDLALQMGATRFGLLLSEPDSPAMHQRGTQLLAELLGHLPESQSLRVVNNRGYFQFDATGNIPRVYVGDRDYFLRQKSGHGGLVVSDPIFARVTNNWVITISRPIYGADGHFLGLIQAAINADHFAQLITEVRLAPTDLLAVHGGADLKMIARLPEKPEHLGQPLQNPVIRSVLDSGGAEKAFEWTSELDGKERSLAFRRLDGYNLIFIYGRDLGDLLTPWREKVRSYIIGVTLLLLSLLAIIASWWRGYLLARHTAEEMQSTAVIEASRLRTLIDSLPDLIWIKGLDLRFQAANSAFARAINHRLGDIIHSRSEDLMAPDEATVATAQDRAVLETGFHSCQEQRVIHEDGSQRVIEMIRVPILGPGGQTIGVAGIGRDMTSHKASEAMIRHMAEHDALTDLPNRLLLSKRIAEMLAQQGANRNSVEMTILFVDLDHFKRINDTLGHDVGDRLLQLVAQRLRAAVFDDDIVSRHGGDEFTVLLLHSASALKTAQIAERILRTLAEPFFVDGHELVLSASVGVALYPNDGADLAALLANADTAMYSAKAAGRNAYRFFTSEMNARIAERLTLENALRKAVDRNELELHFQPQIDLHSGQPVGFEALVRWKHPERGYIPPAIFIPVAEESHLILPVGEWIMRQACQATKVLQAATPYPLHMAINISEVQFRQSTLLATIQECLKVSGIDPGKIELEMTESVLIEDFEHAKRTLARLKQLGLRLAIDDFGTGYSSLSYLRQLPFDTLKIDQSFIRPLSQGQDDCILTETIVAMGHKLRMDVVAEGVENLYQLNYLRQHGCPRVQGYFFARPMKLEQAVEWLEDWPNEAVA